MFIVATAYAGFISTAGVLRVSVEQGRLGEVISANVALCNIFGYPRSEIEGRNIDILVPSPWAEHHDRWLNSLAMGASRTATIEDYTRRLFGLHRNGTIFPLAMTIRQLSGGLDGTAFLAMVTPERLSERDHFLVVDMSASFVIIKASATALTLLGM